MEFVTPFAIWSLFYTKYSVPRLKTELINLSINQIKYLYSAWSLGKWSQALKINNMVIYNV